MSKDLLKEGRGNLTLFDLALDLKDFDWLKKLSDIETEDTSEEITLNELIINARNMKNIYIEEQGIRVEIPPERFLTKIQRYDYRFQVFEAYDKGKIRFFVVRNI